MSAVDLCMTVFSSGQFNDFDFHWWYVWSYITSMFLFYSLFVPVWRSTCIIKSWFVFWFQENLCMNCFTSHFICDSIPVLQIHHPPFIITESINNSPDLGNFVASLADFRSLSYFSASTYTARIKLNNSKEEGDGDWKNSFYASFFQLILILIPIVIKKLEPHNEKI